MRFSRQLAGPNSLPPKIFSHPLPDGDAGITQTIRWMKALTYGPGGVRSAEVRRAALEAVQGVSRGQPEIDSVLDWIRAHIEFRGEYGETLQEPRITLVFGAGDCDDQSMLAAAMYASLGYETRFRTVSLTSDPSELSHVYLEVRDKYTGAWLSIDPTVAKSWPGWQPDDVARSYQYGAMDPKQPSILEGLATAAATLGAILLFS
jgi:transglutaminase-like putative cysteine protease